MSPDQKQAGRDATAAVADKKTVGRRIRERREYLKATKDPRLTQAVVARILGMQRSTYAQYEAGINEMAVSDLGKLAQVLDVKVAYLYGEEDEEDLLDDEAMKFYSGLAPTMKQVARTQLKALFDAQDEDAKSRELTTFGRRPD